MDNSVSIWRHSLIILVGPSGAGKSTFAQKHFPATMWVSTDQCRALICDSAANQHASEDAFELFYFLIEKRLANGCPTIADSTALKRGYREKLSRLADKYHFRQVLIFFDLPQDLCHKQDQTREFSVGEQVLQQQFKLLAKTKSELANEIYDQVIRFKSQEEISRFRFYWSLPLVERSDSGPFDIIGDVHGCYQELQTLLANLGYQAHPKYGHFFHPQKRKAVFLGDILDRGPENVKTLETIYRMWRHEAAYYIPGNHCNKLFRHLTGKNVTINEGLDKTIAEISQLPPHKRQAWERKFCQLYAQAPPYLILDNGRLITVHAGLLPHYVGRADRKVWDCCFYGPAAIAPQAGQDTFAWTDHWSGEVLLVYGHIPVPTPRWHNNTVDIDLGAYNQGLLAALRYPEREIVSVPARKQ